MEFCRLCLTDTNLNINLKSSDNDSILFSDKLKTICEIKINDNELLPTMLCNICGSKIQQFYVFKMLCLQSNILLNRHKNELNKLFIDKLRRKLVPDFNCINLKQDNKGETNEINYEHVDNSDDDQINDGDTQLSYSQEDEEKLTLEDKSSITITNELICFAETINGESSNKPKINELKNRYKSVKKITRPKIQKILSADQNKALTTGTKPNSANRIKTDYMIARNASSKNSRTKNINSDTQNKALDNITPICSKLQCHICDLALENSEEFGKHVTIHIKMNGEAKFECGKCKKMFGNKDLLRRHINKFVKDQYKCDICEKTYYLENSYLKHVKKHDPNQICRKCGLSFPTVPLLKKHEMAHSKDKPYKCHICSKEIKHRSSYSTHMKRHEMTPEQRNARIFSCELCGKTYRTLDNLKIHKISHTTEKTHECSQCGKKFKYSRCLKNHVQIIHVGKRSICTICGKKCVTGSVLKRHMRLHTGEQPYTCQVCLKSFCDQSNYYGHVLTHSNMRTQVCKYCGMQFKQRTYLYTHIKRKHSDVNKEVRAIETESKMAE